MSGYQTRRGIEIPARAVRASFARASGPGGQHVNTSSTKVQVRILLAACEFSPELLTILSDRFGSEVRVEDSSTRSQWRNRSVALRRALDLIDEATVQERRRVPTRATRSSQRRRLDNKTKRSRTKQLRRKVVDE